MSDRSNFMPGYPMIPNNLSLNLAQQISQQQQQSRQPQGIQGVANPDNQQLWQNMQQNFHRAQGGGDSVGQTMTPQMAAFMRNQIAQAQAQSQNHAQGQGQDQRQFTNMPSLNQFTNPNMNQPFQNLQKQQGFNQQQQQVGFGSQMNQLPAQMLARNANPSMLHAISNQSEMVRQIALLGPARNQQPQNGPNPVRLPQTMQAIQSMSNGTLNGQIPFQPGMLPQQKADGVRPPQMGLPSMNLQDPQFRQMLQTFVRAPDGRQLNFPELERKLEQVRGDIAVKDRYLAEMTRNPNTDISALREQTEDLNHRKQLFARFATVIRSSISNAQQQQQLPQPGNGGDNGRQGMNSVNMQNLTASQSSSGGHPQQQSVQSWLHNMNATGFPNQSNQLHAPNHQIPNMPSFSPSPHNQQSTPMSGGTNTTASMLALLNRQQQMSSPHPPANSQMQAGPSVMQQPHSQVQGQQQQLQPSLLPGNMTVEPISDPQKFRDVLSRTLSNANQPLSHQVLSVDNRQIDLHQLHMEVIRLGGSRAVQQRDLWPVVAAKLGWVQFPGSGNEPGRSAPLVASHISNVYNMYLMDVETAYFNSLRNEQHNKLQQMQQAQAQAQNRVMPQLNQQQLLMVKYANMSDDALRAQGIPEAVVQRVITERPKLMNLTALARQQLQQINNSVPASNSNPLQQLVQGNISQSQSNLNQMPTGPGLAASGQQNMMNQHTNSQQSGMDGMNMAGGVSPMNRPAQPSGPPQPRTQGARVPTDEMLQEAQTLVRRLRAEFAASRNTAQMVFKQVPGNQREQYNKDFDELCSLAAELEKRMEFYHAVFNEEVTTRKYLSLIAAVNQQRQLMSSPSPQFIFEFAILTKLQDAVRHGLALAAKAMQALQARGWRPMTAAAVAPSGPPQGTLPPPPPPLQAATENAQSPFNHPSGAPSRPPTSQPPPTQQTPAAASPAPGAPAQTAKPRLSAASAKGKQQNLVANAAADGAPSPAASASTPAPSAVTPSHVASSPQTPKSPKTKAPPKGKAASKRRASKAQIATAPAETPAPALASASTPVASTSSEKSLKRPHDEELQSRSEPASSLDRPPSPKRVKAEPEQVVEDKHQLQTEIESVQTTEDAAKFFDSVTALLNNSGDVPAEVNDMLESIVKSVSSSYDAAGLSGFSSANVGSSFDAMGGRSSPKSAPEEFIDFFDFSSWAAAPDEDVGSKANTPDLVHVSSTNPSPESGSDSESHHHTAAAGNGLLPPKDAAKIASHDTNESTDDPLRMGFWGEIDGGESQYYIGSEGWKWDGPMTTLDNPWAISSS